MLAFRAARAFDGERLIEGGVLVLTDADRIVAVEPASMSLPDAWPVADFSDSTVLPGLIDSHVHLCADGHDGALDRIAGYDEAALGEVIARGLRRQLAAGVTTVRDLGDRDYAVLGWRQSVQEDTAPFRCPTILAAGPPVTSRRGHCWYLGGEAEGLDELWLAVQDRAHRRVDVVKIMASGGVYTPGTDVTRCQYSADELSLVVEEAHALGLPVTAHAHGLPAVDQAVRAGVDGIEHCSCLTPSGLELPDRLLDALAAAQIAVCPTLGKSSEAVPAPALLALMQRTGYTFEARQQLAGRMHRAGVRLVAGSDAGISAGKPHGILPEAVADLIAGGVPAAQALAAATSVAAQACGLGHRKGRLRAGYDADLLLVQGNPLVGISALNRVTAVVLRGTMVHPAY